MRLKPKGLCSPHVIPYGLEAGCIHGLDSQGTLSEELANALRAPEFVDPLLQPGFDLGLVSIANCFDEEFSQRFLVEYPAQDIEHLASDRLPLYLHLLEQSPEDGPLPGLMGNEIPKMAYFALAESVDASKSLLDTVWVSWQVVVDHEVGML